MSTRWQVLRDSAAISRAAFSLVTELLEANPSAVLCLATGASPLGLYQLLAEEHQRRPALFSQVRIVKLDEWYGLPMDHPSTCEAYLQEHFVGPIRLPRERYLSFKSDAADPQRECARISRALARWGGIDLAILGLGVNGHLGLNEPAAELSADAHVAKLTRQSQQHAMLQQVGARATHGLTLGLAQLMHARQILMLVSGQSKRQALQQMSSGRVTTKAPGSLLQLHPRVTLLCDRAAHG